MNEVLQRDITNIKPDAEKRIVPMKEERFQQLLDVNIEELKATFEIYGVPYNQETLEAATVTLIWATKGTQEMFLHSVPVHIEDSPLSYAIHGGLVALNTAFAALEREEDE